MKKFFDKFGSLKGASFIGIRGYCNKNGEVADLSVLVNFDYHKAQEKDLDTLKSLDENDLNDIAVSNDLPISTLKIAHNELIESGEKNLSDEKTNQSIAQRDAYIHLTPGVKMHKETCNVFVYGYVNSKTIKVHGEYPARNKRVKTICKEAIKHHCNLRLNKYRQYNIGEMDKLNISGSTFVVY